MAHAIRFEPLSEDALLLRLGQSMDLATHARVQAVTNCLQRHLPQVECVPAYASVLLRFDPAQWPAEGGPHRHVQAAVDGLLADHEGEPDASREQVIPVCYGGEYGPDLVDVAAMCGLDTDAAIALHAAGDYRVAMLGFAPGFPYLLGLDPRLAVPRRADPRQRVAAGSVAIGGSQTGIYPAALPGGWQVIGRTPLKLFDVHAPTPSLLAAGDRVRFRAIDAQTFRQLAATGS